MEVILLGTLISDKFAAWEAECDQRFNQLKANEEELNRIAWPVFAIARKKLSSMAKEAWANRVIILRLWAWLRTLFD